MFLSTHELEHGRHVARLHRRRRRAYAPTSNAASHDTHEKINPWVSLCSLIWVWGSTWQPSAAGAPLSLSLSLSLLYQHKRRWWKCQIPDPWAAMKCHNPYSGEGSLNQIPMGSLPLPHPGAYH